MTVVIFRCVEYAACPGEYEISSGDGPLPMAIFELLEYIVNEVSNDNVAYRLPTSLTLFEASDAF